MQLLIYILLSALAPSNQWCVKHLASNSPSQVEPGEIFQVDMAIENCGIKHWDPSQVFISYQWYQGNKVVGGEGGRTAMPWTVDPGKAVPVRVEVKAPAKGGKYMLKYDLVRVWTIEGVQKEEWFSALQNPTFDVEVLVTYVLQIWEGLYSPDVTGVLYYKSLHPGQRSWIWGDYLGSVPGKAKARFPSGKVYNIIVEKWYDDVVFIQVPKVVGEQDGQMAIWVEKFTGKKSNEFSVPFKADQEVIQLPNYSTTCTGFELPGACHREHNGIVMCAGYYCGVTIGAHAYNWWSWAGTCGCSGKDSYTLKSKLINNWKITSHKFWWQGFHHDHSPENKNCWGCCPSAALTYSVNAAADMFVADVHWRAPMHDWVYYTLNVYVTGPRGLPYN